ncbi:MAG: PIG-L deacetylase family protein [Patescibacteria group bacterium]
MPHYDKKHILGKNLLVITAHPDDESYVMAGTLAANAKAGGRTLLMCATGGEKGASHLIHPVTPHALARRRKRELRAACMHLHVNRVGIGNIPDGKVTQHTRTFVQAIKKQLKHFLPDIVVSFGPCGITGHKDHIAAGAVARNLAKILKRPFAAAVLSPKLQRDAKNFLAGRRRNPHYQLSTRFVSPNLTIPIDARVKQKALRYHQSQMDGGKLFTGFPKYVVQGLLHREYFRLWKNP